MDDRLKEECGIFGVYNHPEASALVALGLHALQHRGQEACGINSFDGKNFYLIKRRGLVGDNFTDPKIIEQLKGHTAIGHNRYSTTGAPLKRKDYLFQSRCLWQTQWLPFFKFYLNH